MSSYNLIKADLLFLCLFELAHGYAELASPDPQFLYSQINSFSFLKWNCSLLCLKLTELPNSVGKGPRSKNSRTGNLPFLRRESMWVRAWCFPGRQAAQLGAQRVSFVVWGVWVAGGYGGISPGPDGGVGTGWAGKLWASGQLREWLKSDERWGCPDQSEHSFQRKADLARSQEFCRCWQGSPGMRNIWVLQLFGDSLSHTHLKGVWLRPPSKQIPVLAEVS